MELTTGQSAVRGLRSEGKLGLRQAKDAWFRRLMTFGGVSVILAISAIFFYLASVVVPLMRSAQLEDLNQYPLPGPQQERTLHLSSEELAEVGARVTDAGRVVFFDMRNGRPMAEHQARIPAGAAITAFDAGAPHQYATAFGLADGRVLLLKQTYEVTFPNDKRTITPGIEYPLGEEPTVVDEQRAPIRMLSVQHSGEGTTIVALTEDRRILVRSIATSKNLITGEVQLESSGGEVPGVEGEISRLMLEVKQRDLYVLHAGRYISHFDLSDRENPKLVRRAEVLPEGERVSALRILSGGYSLIVGSARGALAQWFLVRDADTGYRLERIREFDPLPGAITVIAPEYFRKGFLAGDERGNVGLYYATSHRTLLQERIAQSPIASATISPRANALMVQDAGGAFRHARIWNEHPEVSWHSLWQKVWYESYEEPGLHLAVVGGDFGFRAQVQPRAAHLRHAEGGVLRHAGGGPAGGSRRHLHRVLHVAAHAHGGQALDRDHGGAADGDPRLSSPGCGSRRSSKATWRERCSPMLFMPLFILVAAYAWHLLPQDLKQRVPAGWEAALLIPVVMLAVYAAIALGHPIEAAFFGGDMPHWLSNDRGHHLRAAQFAGRRHRHGLRRDADIFSIAEDAIFSVPKHLTSGSLALGATPWQTLLYVVLLTASPGIFSAIMIGMGRAVGETMIVLMATGNTAVMDLQHLHGLPHAVGEHRRRDAGGRGRLHALPLLFLSALVLFGFTFFVNTLAELVRQRLRERYSAM
jgi:phosphate transport system permease protein